MMTQASLRLAALLCRNVRAFPGRWRVLRWAVQNVRRVGGTMKQTTVRTVQGFRFTCDLDDWIGQYVFVTGDYEEPTALLMSQLVMPGDTVVDVGANVGFFTLLLSRLVGPAGRVIAFEPMPHALSRLKTHLSLNRCDNVTVLESAVGAGSGTTRLYLGPRHHTSISSLQPRDGAATVEVACTSLDAALSGHGRISLVKIDTEGWEPAVIAGANRLRASEAPPFVIAEVSEPGWPDALVACGFEMYVIEHGGIRRLSKAPRGDGGQFNALFARGPLPPGVRNLS